MAASTAKIAARDQRKARKRAFREQRRRERRCFFVRPFGHEYVDGACVECGRPIVTSLSSMPRAVPATDPWSDRG